MIAAAVTLALLGQAPSPDCAYDKAAMLAMTPQVFDQTLTGGWRAVGNVKGCEAAAADLIAAYRTTNAETLAAAGWRVGLMTWHEAQLRAAAGQTAAALALFKAYDNDSPAMRAYADATVALLERDRTALLAARERLVAIPAPPGFAKSATDYRAQTGQVLSWPVNLDVVDGFIACFDKPYAEAYSRSCRPATPP